MIDFSFTPKTLKAKKSAQEGAEYLRSLARYYDDHEHEELKPEEINRIKELSANTAKIMAEPGPNDGGFLSMIVLSEEQSSGDPMMGGAASNTGLGNAAIGAVATADQKARFGHLYCAMAITEPGLWF